METSFVRGAALVGVLAIVACGGSTPDGSGTPGDAGPRSETSSGGDDIGTDDGALDSSTPTDAGDDANALDTAGDDGSTGDDGSIGDASTGDDTSSTDAGSDTSTPDATAAHAIKTVFVIVMENHSWSDIKGSSSAPFINGLIAESTEVAHAEKYSTPKGNHPSEPNYLWLEGGDNFGITADDSVAQAHQTTTDHVVSQLERAGVTWKSYQENIDGKSCPLTDNGLYAARHNPMVFFDDVTNNQKTTSQHCIDHVRPYKELLTDLTSGKVAQYNFITPNLCDDMHGSLPVNFDCPQGSPFGDLVKTGDDFLKGLIPKIRASNAFKDGGAIFITWDEGSGTFSPSDGPIGMIVVSPLAKPHFTSNTVFDHSSTVRTVETIFGVPFLRHAQTATDLRDMFQTFP